VGRCRGQSPCHRQARSAEGRDPRDRKTPPPSALPLFPFSPVSLVSFLRSPRPAVPASYNPRSPRVGLNPLRRRRSAPLAPISSLPSPPPPQSNPPSEGTNFGFSVWTLARVCPRFVVPPSPLPSLPSRLIPALFFYSDFVLARMFNRAGQGFTAGSELQIGARCSGVLRQVGVFEFILGGGGRGGGGFGRVCYRLFFGGLLRMWFSWRCPCSRCLPVAGSRVSRLCVRRRLWRRTGM
jgi:hypothetical protein